MNRDILQHEAYPFGEKPEERQIQLFNQIKPAEVGGYLPPVETIQDRRSRDPRGLTGIPLKNFWNEVYAEDLSLADLYPFRVVVAWRIIREWAVQIGIIDRRRDTLRESCDVQPSPWTNRKMHFGSRTPKDGRIADLIKDAQGLCFLPPDIPESARGRDDYKPSRDRKLVQWCALVNHIGNTRMALGTTKNGRYGLAGLTDPNIARLAMPIPAEIFALEELLVRQALRQMVETSNTTAMDFLRTKYDLFDHEIQQIIAMAQDSAMDYISDNPQSQRALLMLRCEKILNDCHERMDTRGSILVLREMAKLARLNSTSDEPDVEGMVQEAQLINSQRNPEKILPPPPEL